VWVGGCQNGYTGDQPTPILLTLPQSAHEAFFAGMLPADFQFIPTGQGD
jgi:hypothetical protein